MYLPAVLYVFGGFGAESLSVLLLLLDADFVGSVDILFAEGFLSRILSNKYLVIGGDISYSFYLIHLWILFAYVQLAQTYDWHISLYISIPLILQSLSG